MVSQADHVLGRACGRHGALGLNSSHSFTGIEGDLLINADAKDFRGNGDTEGIRAVVIIGRLVPGRRPIIHGPARGEPDVRHTNEEAEK